MISVKRVLFVVLAFSDQELDMVTRKNPATLLGLE